MKTKTPPGRILAGRSNTNVGDTMRVKDMTKVVKILYICTGNIIYRFLDTLLIEWLGCEIQPFSLSLQPYSFVFSLMWLFPGSVEKRGRVFFSPQMAILGRISRFLILAGITYHPDEENALNQVSIKIKDWPMAFR